MSIYKTPLRYPGGKQRLWAFISEIISSNGLESPEYAEPFAGGAGVGVELLLRNRVSRIHLNDSCPGVHAFWYSIIHESERFCERISRASLTIEEWRRQREIFRARRQAKRFDLGFATFYLNRCNRSGIITGGVIGGLKQAGEWKMDARFSRNDLITRIEAIAARKSAIKIKNWDAERFLTEYLSKLPRRAFVYCDPPYFRKSDRLYPDHYLPEDHSRIARVVQEAIRQPWVVSYDYGQEVMSLYCGRKMFSYSLQYNAAKAYKGIELFIFSDEVEVPLKSSIPSIEVALTGAALQ